MALQETIFLTEPVRDTDIITRVDDDTIWREAERDREAMAAAAREEEERRRRQAEAEAERRQAEAEAERQRKVIQVVETMPTNRPPDEGLQPTWTDAEVQESEVKTAGFGNVWLMAIVGVVGISLIFGGFK